LIDIKSNSPNSWRGSPHGVDPRTDSGHVHPPRQLNPSGAVVALHQVNEVQQQDEGNGDVSVAHVARRLTDGSFYRVPEFNKTDLDV
jgi:hypothetical protein